MDTRKLNDWVQIAATIGVIAGLVLVAYEIRVSNRLGFEQANADRMDRWTTINEVALSTGAVELLIRAREGDELSRVETERLNQFESVVLNTLFYDFTLAETGTVTFPGGFASFYQGVIQGYLGSEISRRHWEVIREYWRPGFGTTIDSALAAPDQRDYLAEIDFIRGTIDRLE